ncbi:MAG: carboxypeptidase-like regulatory domain-containing protein [Bacteroidetes bacterium]|nr:carboxypeptidase-like regulatory domain-containing protein [Bacteroidota bacterium]
MSLLEKVISIPKQNTTLYEALNLISQKANCLFLYESETIESDKKVKMHAENQPLHAVLDNLLSDPSIEYKVFGKHILICKAKQDANPVSKIQPDIPAKDTIKNVIIKGHIYDKENKTAVPFATVGIVEENIGTVTNSDGVFTIKIPSSLIGTSLVVSHLGYMSQTIPVRLLNEQNVDLFLDRRVISIQEVIIRYIDPDLIIEKAMELRKLNYAVDPAYFTTFYREGVRKNNKYISYSEAVFRIYKSPYTAGEHADQVKLLKSRKFKDANPRDTVFLKLKAGVQSALQLDIVKNVPGFLDLTPPVEYTYRYSDLVSYNAKDAYAITFVQKPDLKKPLYTGTVYIEKEGFALLGADFEINPAYIDIAAGDLVLKKSSRLIVKLEKISYSISYMPFNGRYYLSHVRCDIQLRTRLKNHLSTDNFYTFLELANCNIDTAGVIKFPRQEILKPNVVFSEQPYQGDDAFWGDFNTITPETKLSEALSKIIGKIEEIR